MDSPWCNLGVMRDIDAPTALGSVVVVRVSIPSGGEPYSPLCREMNRKCDRGLRALAAKREVDP